MCVQNGMLTICGEAQRFVAAHPTGLPEILTGPKSGHRRLTFAGGGARGKRRFSRIRAPWHIGSRIVSPRILSQNCYDKFTCRGISVIGFGAGRKGGARRADSDAHTERRPTWRWTSRDVQIAVRARKAHRGWPIVGASAPDLSALTFDPCPRTGPYPALSHRKKLSNTSERPPTALSRRASAMREPPESVRLTHRASAIVSGRIGVMQARARPRRARPPTGYERARPALAPVRLPFSNVSERAHTRLT
ncbi:Uncharacterised protein [Burkholderia pseudomallei]|nr:Uncharacterised protein [Burkholderia pseudomallei]